MKLINSRKSGNYDKQILADAIARYDELWEEWRLLLKEPTCATIYTDKAFRSLYKGSIAQMTDNVQEILKD